MAVQVVINTDGGARGNPGPAAIGIVIRSGESVLAEHGEYIGETTNNYAEYEALIRALSIAEEKLGEQIKGADIEIRMDSELIVRQMEGRYKVKEPTLKEQHARVRELLDRAAPGAHFKHVPRAENAEADALVNAALDARA